MIRNGFNHSLAFCSWKTCIYLWLFLGGVKALVGISSDIRCSLWHFVARSCKRRLVSFRQYLVVIEKHWKVKTNSKHTLWTKNFFETLHIFSDALASLETMLRLIKWVIILGILGKWAHRIASPSASCVLIFGIFLLTWRRAGLWDNSVARDRKSKKVILIFAERTK